MRDILSKVMTGSMIAGAALIVAACGGGSEANNTAESNAIGTDVFNDVPADNGSGLNGTDALGGNGTGGLDNSGANVSANVDAGANVTANGTNTQ